MSLGARYFPRTSDPQQMVIEAANAFREDTGRYPTHVAISRLYKETWGSSQVILPDQHVAIMVVYRDDVAFGWVKCVRRPQQATFVIHREEGT